MQSVEYNIKKLMESFSRSRHLFIQELRLFLKISPIRDFNVET